MTQIATEKVEIITDFWKCKSKISTLLALELFSGITAEILSTRLSKKSVVLWVWLNYTQSESDGR